MTIFVCPAGCGGVIDTGKSMECTGCRLPANVTRTKENDNWCWEWFGRPYHRMKCRRDKGHPGPHVEHEEDDPITISYVWAYVQQLEQRIEKLKKALTLCEHKIDQHLQGQYPNGSALGNALFVARAALKGSE